MPIYSAQKKVKLNLGNKKVKAAYLGNRKVYSSGNICIYIVRGVSYTQEYEAGQSVLSPTVVTPALTGATFLGWSVSLSSTSVVKNLVMGDAPITLYAVFKYPDSSVASVVKAYIFRNNEPIHKTETVYVLDTAKYESHTVTASVPVLETSNNTTGYMICQAYVDGVEVRRTVSSEQDSPFQDAGEFVGTNGEQFQLTKDGNLTIGVNLPGFPFGSSGAQIKIIALKLNGKTIVG